MRHQLEGNMGVIYRGGSVGTNIFANNIGTKNGIKLKRIGWRREKQEKIFFYYNNNKIHKISSFLFLSQATLMQNSLQHFIFSFSHCW